MTGYTDPLDLTSLDNPIWNSLRTEHAHLALGADRALRYPPDVSPLCGMREQSPEAYAELAALLAPGEAAVLFLTEDPRPPADWMELRRATMIQMICPAAPPEPALREAIVGLDAASWSEMTALAALTEPGPFCERTALLGGFHGIRMDSRLAAMAGRRTAPTGFREVSAVCTHPEFRGRGLAKALVAAVAREIHADRCVPFLELLESNAGARRVYEQVGFVVRRTLVLAVVRPPDGGAGLASEGRDRSSLGGR